jgi:hypothetical protein
LATLPPPPPELIRSPTQGEKREGIRIGKEKKEDKVVAAMDKREEEEIDRGRADGGVGESLLSRVCNVYNNIFLSYLFAPAIEISQFLTMTSLIKAY